MLTFVDYTTAGLSVLSAASWVIWSIRNRAKVLYAVPPLTWTANVVLFYIFHLFGMSPLIHQVWSDVIQLQVAFLLFGVGIIVLFERFAIR